MATILIVEDSPDNMKLFRTLLTLRHHAVTGLVSGEGLLTAIEQAQPALVLMDIQLPGISGIEALKRLRAVPATASIPVIAVTASVMASDRRNITDAGFDGYVGKPLNLREFLDAVAGAIGPAGA